MRGACVPRTTATLCCRFGPAATLGVNSHTTSLAGWLACAKMGGRHRPEYAAAPKGEVKAVYENGVLTPLEPLDLPDRQRVTLSIQVPEASSGAEALSSWHQVYAGLAEEELRAIEGIILDRAAFMRPVR